MSRSTGASCKSEAPEQPCPGGPGSTLVAMFIQNIDIAFNREVLSGTFLMGLIAPEIVAEARPGQFVMIRVSAGSDPLLRRPFSICGTRKDRLLLILYKVVGQGTSILSRTMEGEQLSVLGPLGTGFELPDTGRAPILVAGGMGTAPLLFLAQAMGPEDLTFLAGYRSKEEVLDIDEIGFSGMNISIATDDGSFGHPGLVTELLEAHLKTSEDRGFEIYTCGPMPMIRQVASLALSSEISCQVSLETTMACGLGACQGCVVKSASPEQTYIHVCKDGPVFHAGSLDWEYL